MALAAIAVLILGAAGGWLLFGPDRAPAQPPRLLQVALPDFDAELLGWPHGSADGRYWSFSALDSSATPVVVIWDVLTNKLRNVPDSDVTWDARFSPSGEWLASVNNDAIFRARVPGGRALRIYSGTAGGVSTIDWIDDETILFSDDTRLNLLSIESGAVTEVALSDVDSTYTDFIYVQYVGASGHVLLEAVREGTDVDLLWVDLETGATTVLMQAVGGGRMLREDLLLYLSVSGSGAEAASNVGQVVAQRIDPKAGRLSGIPVDVAELDVLSSGFGLARDGTLFMLQGTFASGGGQYAPQVFTRFNPVTKVKTSLGLPLAGYDRFWPSPDGSQLVVERSNTSGPDTGTHLYIIDLSTKSERRLTYANPINRAPVWSRDGVIYYSVGPSSSPQTQIYYKNADGSGPEQRLVEQGDFPVLSPDGVWLAYSRDDGENGGDVEALNLETGEVIVVDSTAGYSGDPSFSPNGRFIVMSKAPPSDGTTVSPEQRIFVHSFPDPTRFSIQVVDEYSDDPFWSTDGRTMYYRNGAVLKRISVETGDAFSVQSVPSIAETFPGAIQMRVRNDPRTGELLVKHAPGLQENGSSNDARFNVLLSADAYVRALMGEN
jgi:hypothetical protein